MKIENIKAVTETLDHGLTVTFVPMNEANSVTAMCAIKSGGRDDPDDKLGIAHLVEHMIYKGNKFFTYEQFNNEAGVRGIIHNAWTGGRRIVHYMTGVSTETEWIVRNLCRLVCTPTFPEDELERERTVVLNEFNFRRDRRDNAVYDNLRNVMFRDSDHQTMAVPTIGSEECVKSITRDDLLRYHTVRYCLNNMHLYIGGNFNVNEVRRIIVDEMTNSLPEGILHKHVEHREVPMRFDVKEYHAEDNMCQILFGWRIPGALHRSIAHIMTDDIIEYALFNGPLSKFYNEIREKAGLCYQCYGSFIRDADIGLCCAGGGTQIENVKKFTALMRHEIEDFYYETPYRKRLIASATKCLINTWRVKCDDVGTIIETVESLHRMTDNIITPADVITYFERNGYDEHRLNDVVREFADDPTECYILQGDKI